MKYEDATGRIGFEKIMKGRYQPHPDKAWTWIPLLENQTDTFAYRELDWKVSFERVKFEYYEEIDGELIRTGKKILYRHKCDVRAGCDWKDEITGEIDLHWEKPKRADSLIYCLPLVVAVMRRGGRVYICEGERDAEYGYMVLPRHRLGIPEVLTTHHQGAEVGPNSRQAAWLKGYDDIHVIMDNDSAGAWCAYRWCELLDWKVAGIWRPPNGLNDLMDIFYNGGEHAGRPGEIRNDLLQKVEGDWLIEKAKEHAQLRRDAWIKRGKRNAYVPGVSLDGEAE